MTIERRTLCWVYGAIAVLALLATWNQNLAFFTANTGPDGAALFWRSTVASQPAASITLDLFLFATAASTWMVVEARRLGIRFVWVYVVLGIFVAISFTFPLFLIARELRLARANVDATTEVARSDAIGIAVASAPVVLLSLWSLVW